MKINIVYLLLIALLGITVSASVAQQNQNVPKTVTEVEAVKKRVSELEGKLQTVENVEKMELAAKLAEAKAKHDKAHAKLIETEFDKLKLELKDSNEKWLLGWIGFFGVMFAVFGVALWFVVKSMIADRVEERLNEFKESVDKVRLLEDQIKILEKEHAVTVLQDYAPGLLTELERHIDRIKALTDEVLLDIFSDKTRDLQIKWVAADVLVAREIPQFVSPMLKFLNSIVDSDIDIVRNFNFSYTPQYHLSGLVMFVGKIHTLEAYNGLKSFLNHLLTKNPKNKDLFIAWTAHSLASVSVALNKKDSISMLIESIPDWDFVLEEHETIEDAAKCFNLLNAPEGIKEIFNVHAKGKIPELEEKCLELLEKYYPDFVKEQREEKATANTESEES